MGDENETCKIPDGVRKISRIMDLLCTRWIDYAMLDCWRECKMSTLCTAFPSFSRKGDIPLHTSKNRAKTTAQINVQEIIPINELQPSWRSHLEFYALRSRPPCLRQTTSYFKIG
jgi:hypothetical protein